MDVPDPAEMLERLRALPAFTPLLPRLGREPPAYVVGGAVRDLLLGGEPLDLDLVVEGDAAAFAATIGDELRVHDRFGTSTARVAGHTYDVACSRRELYSRPGALPDVEQAPVTEDLLRRDFTVNALAIALDGPVPGELHAAPRALEDLRARTLRVLHGRSFVDDPTRLLRLARYASRLGFAVEPATRTLAGDALAAGALQTVSGSRLGAELKLLVSEPDPVAALRALGDLGIDRAIHPGFGLDDEPLSRRALGLLPTNGRPDRLVLSLAARGVPHAELGGLLDSLALRADDRDAIVSAATRSDRLAQALQRAKLPSEIMAAVGDAPPETVALAGALGAEQPAREWLDRLRHVKLEIGGGDLRAAGVSEGPAIGRGLRAALAAKLDGRADGRERELETAVQAARDGG